MYKNKLVADYIKHGRKVLEALQHNKFPITEAFWYDVPELGEWRLIIASPIVHLLGPNHAYTLLDNVLNSIGSPFSLGDISLFSPLSSEFQTLRQVALGPGRLGMGPATGRVHDVTFQDAYLYTLPSPMQPHS